MLAIADLRTFLQIPTGKDSELQSAINAASGFVSGFIGYDLTDVNKTAIFYGYDNTFLLKHRYIKSVDTIKYWADEFSSLTTYTKSASTVKEFLELGKVKTKDVIGPYIEIAYKKGFDENWSETPDDLKTALLELAKMYYLKIWVWSISDISSESVDGDSISYKWTTGEVPEHISLILTKYKSYGFSA